LDGFKDFEDPLSILFLPAIALRAIAAASGKSAQQAAPKIMMRGQN
jgi:hypothetical protein